jgi:hypothetical protein
LTGELDGCSLVDMSRVRGVLVALFAGALIVVLRRRRRRRVKPD